jgi:purine nucleoside phosphorylase
LYDNAFSKHIRKVARSLSLPLKSGVYVALAGPSFETLAEVRAFQKLGADVVGMSTVPEAIASAHAGMEVAALSAISNSCLVKHYTPSHADVLRQAHEVDRKLGKLLLQLLDSKIK